MVALIKDVVTKTVVKKIAFTGNIGNGNLGDEISAASAIQFVKQRFPDCELIAFSYYPDETAARHNVIAYPASRYAWKREERKKQADQEYITRQQETSSDSGSTSSGYDSIHQDSDQQNSTVHHKPEPVESGLVSRLKKFAVLRKLAGLIRNLQAFILDTVNEVRFIIYSYHNLENVDLLISAGGGQFSDQFGGAWNFPFSHYRWASLCRLRGIDVAFVSVGVTPAESMMSGFFIGRALNKAMHKSFRDDYSRHCAEKFGVKNISGVYPDLAFAYRRRNMAVSPKTHDRTVVGISLFPHCDPRYWPEVDEVRYRRYLETMAAFSNGLLNQGYQLHFFPTQIRSDSLVIADVIEIMKAKIQPSLWNQINRVYCEDIDELMNELAQMDVAVVTRYHGLIMSFMEQTPVIAIANHQKMFDIMKSVNLGEYALDINSVTDDELLRKFDLLVNNREAVVKSLREKVQSNRATLMNMYDKIFSSYIQG